MSKNRLKVKGMLFGMAPISEGGKIDDPAGFTKRVGELMADAL